MEKDKLDLKIRESLMDEAGSLKMSYELKKRIMDETVKKKSIYKKFRELMNTTVEIPIPPVMAAFLIIFFMTFWSFTATDRMKMDKTIKGYTSIKVINMGGIEVYQDIGGGESYEKDKD
ncbi:hypothetical protein OXPF_33470 [Oxobacter pfennigii]|uniref:Uncharacterized protein n=1 Tax=Oxobacter pfennigii TaxID=36849 RepID=A0A0P8Y8N2_9CLOT|nr:hypothetical protein [Oxobacter pfennigii]KPU43097.1 hypothetical protein OXPF_33470 [Oxobacter pfennigii]